MVNKYSLFPFLWQAKFADGHSVRQDPQDRYSKFDPKATYNPSSFRDFLDYSEANPDTPLMEFRLENERKSYVVSFADPKRPVIFYEERNRYGDTTKHYELVKCKRALKNARPIYYRRMEMEMNTGVRKILKFVIGFQGNEQNDRNYKKTISVL